MTYATTPCHSFCPVYNVMVGGNGAGIFTGTSNTAVIGQCRFTAPPEQVADIFQLPHPYLPVGELLMTGPDACKTYATDPPSVDVRWTGETGSGHLLFG